MSSMRLIFGFHAVIARLRHDPESLKEIFLDADRHDKRIQDLLKYAQQYGVKTSMMDGKRLDAMLPEASHQGVIASAKGERRALHLDDVLDTLEEPPLLLVLDGITDPRNLGACLRVADGAGAHAVIAPKDRSAGLTSVAEKTACGAAETIPYITVTNLARTLRELQERAIHIIGTSGEAALDIYGANWPQGCAWVLGSEDKGIRRLTREHCDQVLKIPMSGNVESLNVSVAAAICLFEAKRRKAGTGL